MNSEDFLRAKGYQLINGQWWHKSTPAARSAAPDPQPEQAVCNRSYGPIPGKEGHTEGRRLSVKIVSYRRRLIDPDNLTVKYHVDALKYLGIIPNDTAKDIEVSVRQEKVNEFQAECTEITVDTIPPTVVVVGHV